MRVILAFAVVLMGFVMAAPAQAAKVEARVDISSQKMRVYRNGRLVHVWKVSTGRSGFGTPTGNWSAKRMHKTYYSKKYKGAAMPYSIFYHHGFAIHGTNSVKRLGRKASHGCIRLHPSHARKLFNMTKAVGRSNMRVRVKY